MNQFERNLSLVSSVLGCSREPTSNWFVGFGSLLYLIRDHKHAVEFNQDIDICYMGTDYEEVRPFLLREGITSEHKIVDDRNGKILFDALKFEDGMSLDIFTWLKAGDNLWHTYDYSMEFPESGIPTKYHFKSLPIKLLHPGPQYRYEYSYDEYTYIPRLYGSLLDYWYPNWMIPDPNFGVSKAHKILTLGGCEQLCQ